MEARLAHLRLVPALALPARGWFGRARDRRRDLWDDRQHIRAETFGTALFHRRLQIAVQGADDPSECLQIVILSSLPNEQGPRIGSYRIRDAREDGQRDVLFAPLDGSDIA